MNSNSSNALQPCAIESEQALLGCMLLDNEQIDKVVHYLPHDNVFYLKQHMIIWQVIQKLRSEGKSIDLVTLTSEIPEQFKSDATAYDITDLPNHVASPSSAINYARTMYEKWLMRNLIAKSRRIEDIAKNPTSSAIESLESLYNSIGDALNLQTSEHFSIPDLIAKTIDNLHNKDNTIPFGIGEIDSMTGGMTRGEITVIAGRPGHFKSTMMINIVSNIVKKGYKVLVLNREMSNVEMMKKLIVIESAKLSYDRIRSAELTKDDEDDIIQAKQVILDKYKNLIMYDDIMDIGGAMREIRKHKPDVVVDDYIGLVNVKGIDDNRLRIDSIMKQYKWAAKNNNMSVLLLSQLNRKCEERTNKRPLPSDLRESGSIEQDAEMILFMYYEWRYIENLSTLGEYGLEVIVGKNRYGRTGSRDIGVAGHKCKIYESPDIAIMSSMS